MAVRRRKEISHKNAKMQKIKATEKESLLGWVACRYPLSDMDQWTPGYTNEFAYQGVSRSVRPADAGQRDMRSYSEKSCESCASLANYP